VWVSGITKSHDKWRRFSAVEDYQNLTPETRVQVMRTRHTRNWYQKHIFSFVDRSFGAASPRIWNSLPCGLRTLDISYKHLKHYWRHMCLTRPRRFVTFYISALEILLLTYFWRLRWWWRYSGCNCAVADKDRQKRDVALPARLFTWCFQYLCCFTYQSCSFEFVVVIRLMAIVQDEYDIIKVYFFLKSASLINTVN